MSDLRSDIIISCSWISVLPNIILAIKHKTKTENVLFIIHIVTRHDSHFV